MQRGDQRRNRQDDRSDHVDGGRCRLPALDQIPGVKRESGECGVATAYSDRQKCQRHLRQIPFGHEQSDERPDQKDPVTLMISVPQGKATPNNFPDPIPTR